MDTRERRTRVRARGARNGATSLTDDQVREIRQLRREGVYPTAIARQFQINRSTVRKIAERITWSHLDD